MEVSYCRPGPIDRSWFSITRSLATTLVEAARTSPSLGVITGSVGRGSGAPAKEAEFPSFSIRVLASAGGVSSTSTGVAMTPTARIVARMYERKTLTCILNKRGAGD